MALTTWDEQAYAEAKRAAIAQNGARNARSLHRLGSKGAGEVHVVQPISFDVTFVVEPTFTTGVTLGVGQLIAGAYPIATVGVYKWQLDGRKFYVGAYVWVAVTFAPSSVDLYGGLSYQNLNLDQTRRVLSMAQLQLQHHLCFEGMALRDVDYDRIMGN